MNGSDRKSALPILAVTGLVGVIFSIAGVAMVANLAGAERLAGAAFGVMGLICLVIASTYGIGGLIARPRVPSTAPLVPTSAEVPYRRSASGYVDVIVGVGAALFISVMLAFSVALIGSGEVAGLGFLLIASLMWLLIVPATILGLIRLAADRSVLVLTPDGLRLHGVGWIPWTDVERLSIEDTTRLVAEPGTQVIGSMRQLAIHLRAGAEPPRGNALDEALRAIGKGYLAIGAAAGRGRYQWLAVRERDIGVPLEEVLDVASVYHARVVGVDTYGPVVESTTPVSATAPSLEPRLATISTPPDPVLAAEAAAVVARGRADAARRSGRLRRWIVAAITGTAALFVAVVLFMPTVGRPTTAPTTAPPATIRAEGSSEQAAHPAAHAIDGRSQTTWNAGGGPPARLAIDLGAETSVASIRLLTEQTPSGRTVHQIRVIDAGSTRLVHVFDGETRSGQWLTFMPEVPLRGVRIVLIETLESPSWVAWREVEIVRVP